MDNKKQMIGALDLFAGAGGFSIGMENAGFNVIAAVEFNPKIAETYKYNHKNTTLIIDDITNVSASKEDPINKVSSINIQDIFKNKNINCDIIFGGPPCQGFSMSGYRIRNNIPFLEDKRNLLFKEFIRMVKFLNPKVFVIENVPGILNYDNGRVKNEIFQAFNHLGYDIEAKVLCAADYGVPQLRNRAFFIGNRIGIKSDYLFPERTHTKENYISVSDAINDIPPINAGEGFEKVKYYKNNNLTEYQYKLRGDNKLLYNHSSPKHKKETIKILSMIKQGQTMKDLPENMKTKSVHSGAYGRMEANKPAYTLTTRLNTPSVGRITHPTQHRTITPREAARIQSFPDRFRFIGDITSIGMQIGNAVPPILAEKIGLNIIKYL
ncbi:DNA cytosine methyltransferase [Aliarcobacter cryaerophilus]|uniref:DNA cytosine methyltransferase n=1 Tax=Aliarcobacter cryaerophilus TaxID=28198 RepID=UPI0021B1DB32|nr:DNA cytosine methyltransferase [Aliarcobacter cryaerophilus]MCT7464885.1 DNA cytosine methyltransferase [Aliarcobacter cryaerophilus]